MSEGSMTEENGIKGNTGDFAFPASASKPRRKRKPAGSSSSPGGDGGAKLIIALLAGAGAAFLLALILLMSRLESDEVGNGLLNSNVGGVKGVDDDAVIAEEVAQGHASPALLQHGDAKAKSLERQGRIIQKMHQMKAVYDHKLGKLDRMFGLPKGNPLDKLVHEGEEDLGGIEKVLRGEGKMPKFHNLKKDFEEAIHDGDPKWKETHEDAAAQRKRHQAERRKKRELEGGDDDDANHKRKMKEREKKENEKLKNERREIAKKHDLHAGGKAAVDDGGHTAKVAVDLPSHLQPIFPPMPPHVMAEDLFGQDIITNALSHDKPTMAGIIAILQRFLRNLHQMLLEKKHAETPDEVIEAYFDLVHKWLEPLERAYRDREIFPIREDGSIFMSLGAYRDHLLGETLRQAFKTAAYPDKLFVGAVVQNCFGIDVQCRTGVEVKGKDKRGHPITEISDKSPDVNGIQQFCEDPDYAKYCGSGQIRALYVNETESNGPTTARYFASKLWGGETYFLQADAHLRFAPEWDRLYAEEVKAAKAYPKAVLSAYPPGFNEEDPPYHGGSQGTRLCSCMFSDSDVEHRILRINTGNQCRGEEPAPSQIAYIAAGFFFARAEFLVDVPFDPYLPWCFMGEEIALSLRAWTHGWDIYAPRKNLIAHQYRPGRMGLPKFWENTGRVFGRPGPGFNTRLQTITIQRIKYMVGYKEQTKEWLEDEDYQIVLTDFEHYGPGDVRTMKAFLEHVNIDMENEQCKYIDWCNQCTLK